MPPAHRRAAALAAALLAAAGAPRAEEALAAAPDAPGFAERLAAEGRDIAPDEWRALTAGRTVWYRIGEDFWGRERYARGADRVTFQFADGTCVEAAWRWADPWYCFDFGAALAGDGPHCFRHVEHEGGLWALSARGAPQEIARIDAAPLTCGPAPVS